jgi:uncharacterized phage protein (TIGR01671 family)
VDGEAQVICGDENYGSQYENVEIVQWTGLRDSKRTAKYPEGQRIYEGDVIKFVWETDSCWGKAGTHKGYIRFDGGVFEVVYIGKIRKKRFKEKMDCFDDIKSFIEWSEKVEVIGNIYETPEVLNGLE